MRVLVCLYILGSLKGPSNSSFAISFSSMSMCFMV